MDGVNLKKKRCGFTLSEVMVTMVLLGLLALLLISGLVSDKNKAPLNSAIYDKVYEDVFTASKAALSIDKKNSEEFQNNSVALRNDISKYLDISSKWERCDNWNEGTMLGMLGKNCADISGTTLNNGVDLAFVGAGNNPETFAAQLQNINPNININRADVVGAVLVDTNGMAGPNTPNNDQYAIPVYRNGIGAAAVNNVTPNAAPTPNGGIDADACEDLSNPPRKVCEVVGNQCICHECPNGYVYDSATQNCVDRCDSVPHNDKMQRIAGQAYPSCWECKNEIKETCSGEYKTLNDNCDCITECPAEEGAMCITSGGTYSEECRCSCTHPKILSNDNKRCECKEDSHYCKYVDTNNDVHDFPGGINEETCECNCDIEKFLSPTTINGKSTCSCPPGYYWDGETCVLCPPGQYCPEGDPEPKNKECRNGYYNPSEGATAEDFCSPCSEPNSIATSDHTSCMCDAENGYSTVSDSRLICCLACEDNNKQHKADSCECECKDTAANNSCKNTGGMWSDETCTCSCPADKPILQNNECKSCYEIEPTKPIYDETTHTCKACYEIVSTKPIFDEGICKSCYDIDPTKPIYDTETLTCKPCPYGEWDNVRKECVCPTPKEPVEINGTTTCCNTCNTNKQHKTNSCDCECKDTASKNACENTGGTWSDETCTCSCPADRPIWDSDKKECVPHDCPPGTVWNEIQKKCVPSTCGDDYIKIYTAEQLASIGRYEHPEYPLSGKYCLMNDIDLKDYQEEKLEGASWYPIGEEDPFTGIFDGNNFSIKNLNIVRCPYFTGLFGLVIGGWIRNLAVTNINIECSVYTGGIAGITENAMISNSYVSGTINVYSYYNGGLVGSSTGSIIQQCLSDVDINVFGYGGGGSFVGELSDTVISDCYATGEIKDENPEGWSYGFIWTEWGGNNISNVYSLSTSPQEEMFCINPGWTTVHPSVFCNSDIDKCLPKCIGGATVRDSIALTDPNTYLDAGWSPDVWCFNCGDYPVLINMPYAAPHSDTCTACVTCENTCQDFEERISNSCDCKCKNPEKEETCAPEGKDWVEALCSCICPNGTHPDENGVCRLDDNLNTCETNFIAIYTAEQLASIGVKEGYSLTDTYCLMNDIDLTEYQNANGGSWTPIAPAITNNTYPDNKFSGTFDGNKHIIKNMYINANRRPLPGLFGAVAGAAIRYLGLENASITNANSEDNARGIGLLAGLTDGCEIHDCYVVGSIEDHAGYYLSTGGFVGNAQSTAIQHSYSVTNRPHFTSQGHAIDNYSQCEADNYQGITTCRTEEHMKNANTFGGWSTDVWCLSCGQYPVFKNESNQDSCSNSCPCPNSEEKESCITTGGRIWDDVNCECTCRENQEWTGSECKCKSGYEPVTLSDNTKICCNKCDANKQHNGSCACECKNTDKQPGCVETGGVWSNTNCNCTCSSSKNLVLNSNTLSCECKTGYNATAITDGDDTTMICCPNNRPRWDSSSNECTCDDGYIEVEKVRNMPNHGTVCCPNDRPKWDNNTEKCTCNDGYNEIIINEQGDTVCCASNSIWNGTQCEECPDGTKPNTSKKECVCSSSSQHKVTGTIDGVETTMCCNNDTPFLCKMDGKIQCCSCYQITGGERTRYSPPSEGPITPDNSCKCNSGDTRSVNGEITCCSACGPNKTNAENECTCVCANVDEHCPSEQWNEETCSCDCPNGQTWSTTEHECVCDMSCGENKVLAGTATGTECRCECLNNTEQQAECLSGGGTWNENACTCDCPNGGTWNSEINQCITDTCANHLKENGGEYIPIRTWEDMEALASGSNASYPHDGKYCVMSDLPRTYPWEHPIPNFTGIFDGNYHAIDYDFKGGGSQCALFGSVNGGTIKNLRVDAHFGVYNANYPSGLGFSCNQAASLVHALYNNGTVENCSAEIEFISNAKVGGLIYEARGSRISNSWVDFVITSINNDAAGFIYIANDGTQIDHCYSHGTLKGETSANNSNIATSGFIANANECEIRSCYSDATIDAPHRSASGFVDHAAQESYIHDCYSGGNITHVIGRTQVGGFVAQMWGNGYNSCKIENSYFKGTVNGYQNVGGFVGSATTNAIINNSFAVANFTTFPTKPYNLIGGFAGSVDLSNTYEKFKNVYFEGTNVSASMTEGGNCPDNYCGSFVGKINKADGNNFGNILVGPEVDENNAYGYCSSGYCAAAQKATKSILSPEGWNYWQSMSPASANWDFDETWCFGPEGVPVLRDMPGDSPNCADGGISGIQNTNHSVSKGYFVDNNNNVTSDIVNDSTYTYNSEENHKYTLNKDAGSCKQGDILLYNGEDLRKIGKASAYPSTASYCLVNDIRLYGFESPIVEFMGKFNGNGKTISDLNIYQSDKPGGLFSKASGEVTISNLILDDITVATDTNREAGALIGLAHDSDITIDNVIIKSPMINSSLAGVLIGSIETSDNLNISNVTVEDAYINGERYAGGLVGKSTNETINLSNITIDNADIASPKSSESQTDAAYGGLIGSSENEVILSDNINIRGVNINSQIIANIGLLIGVEYKQTTNTAQISIIDSDIYSTELILYNNINIRNDINTLKNTGIADSYQCVNNGNNKYVPESAFTDRCNIFLSACSNINTNCGDYYLCDKYKTSCADIKSQCENYNECETNFYHRMSNTISNVINKIQKPSSEHVNILGYWGNYFTSEISINNVSINDNVCTENYECPLIYVGDIDKSRVHWN